MEPIASLCAKLVVSNIDASVCTIDVDTTALADTSADIPEECEADVIHELDQYKQDEDAIFAELAEFNSAFQQELADGGLAAAILRLLPEPETPVFVPPILEKSKRPINHSKKQKAILMEWLIKHKDDPYPTDIEKEELCTEADMTFHQLCRWFQNARTRLLPEIRGQAANASSRKKRKIS